MGKEEGFDETKKELNDKIAAVQVGFDYGNNQNYLTPEAAAFGGVSLAFRECRLRRRFRCTNFFVCTGMF